MIKIISILFSFLTLSCNYSKSENIFYEIDLKKLQNEIILSNSYDDLLKTYSNFNILESDFKTLVKGKVFVLGENFYVILADEFSGVSVITKSDVNEDVNLQRIDFERNSDKVSSLFLTKDSVFVLNHTTIEKELKYLISVVNDRAVVYDNNTNQYIILNKLLP